jgi:ElaB/YqjD/DUF883 family membrane-anchored ribosome-binding protein
MENSVTSNYAKSGQALADKAADKAKDAANSLSGKVQSLGKQGLDAVTDAVSQARDVVTDTSDSIVAYTKKNPVTALAIAAASGALLYAAIRALIPSRD